MITSSTISETKPQLFMCLWSLSKLAHLSSTMEKAKALHKSSRYIYCVLMAIVLVIVIVTSRINQFLSSLNLVKESPKSKEFCDSR